MERINWQQISSTQAKRRITKMYNPMLCPKGSSFGSDKEPAMK